MSPTNPDGTGGGSEGGPGPGPLRLRIKCGATGLSLDPGGEVAVSIPPAGHDEEGGGGNGGNGDVALLKRSVRDALGPGAAGRYLRLIVRGRLLAPDSAPLADFGLGGGDVVHAVLAAPGVRGGRQAALAGGGAAVPGDGGGGSHRRRRRRRGTGTGGAGGGGAGVDATGRAVRRPVAASAGDGEDSDGDGNSSSDGSAGDVEAGGRRRRRGFDRLRDSGLSRSEVDAVRLYFTRQVDRYSERQRRRREAQTAARVGEEGGGGGGGDSSSSSAAAAASPPADFLALEEEWMAAQGPTSEFRLNLNARGPLLSGTPGGGATAAPNAGTGAATLPPFVFRGGRVPTASAIGTDRDFLWGFVLGFFVGFVMMFWVWLPTVPHKQKLGLLAGMCCNLVLGMGKDMDDDDDDNGGGGDDDDY